MSDLGFSESDAAEMFALLGVKEKDRSEDEIDAMAEEISLAEPEIEEHESGGVTNFRISLPYGCEITGYNEKRADGSWESNSQFLNVPKEFRKKGIGRRLIQAWADWAREKGVTKLRGHVTSVAALATRASVFGEDNLKFFDHTTGKPVDVSYAEALEQYKQLENVQKKVFSGNLDVESDLRKKVEIHPIRNRG
jgi:GNAT superfamily N-acetyltransferase